MTGLVEDIKKGAMDMTGAEIMAVFSKVSTKYAVYLTEKRIMVQFADDDAVGKQQRDELRELNPFRSEINSLLDGWEDNAWWPSKERRAALVSGFNTSVADALVLALQGDAASGKIQIEAVRDGLRAERLSIGRLEYLVMAALVGIAVVVLAQVIPSQFGTSDIGAYFAANQTRLAIGVGVLGTLFSIAWNITGRSINTDLQRRDNLVDAVLRIGIGAVSAVILFALLKGDIVSIKLGSTELKPGTADPGVALAVSVVIAFLAGFSERLVGNVLGTVGLATVDQPAAPVAPRVATGTGKKDEDNPSGKPATTGADAAAQPAPADTAVSLPEDSSNVSVSEVPPTGDEITEDSELPQAYGGVERPA